jgi:hypothetical protein
MKRRGILLATLLVLALIIGSVGCNNGQGTPTPSPTPTLTLTPTPMGYCNPNCECHSYTLARDIQCSQAGAICKDGTCSTSTGRGTCSWHGGVKQWINCP